jgi:hypothetical protein
MSVMRATDALLSACLGLFLLGMSGCAKQESFDSLEKRVTALEEKQKSKETEAKDRQSKLEKCVTVDADEAYWTYVRLNGKAVAGQPGVYTAPQYVWNSADRQKKDKMEECKLLYGPR